MSDATALPFAFPSVRGKAHSRLRRPGCLTSDGGMCAFTGRPAVRIAEKLAAVIPDRRDPSRVLHPLPEILLARILAIAPAATKMPTTPITCAPIPPSSSPAACPSGLELMSQPPSRLRRTRPACAI